MGGVDPPLVNGHLSGEELMVKPTWIGRFFTLYRVKKIKGGGYIGRETI